MCFMFDRNTNDDWREKLFQTDLVLLRIILEKLPVIPVTESFFSVRLTLIQQQNTSGWGMKTCLSINTSTYLCFTQGKYITNVISDLIWRNQGLMLMIKRPRRNYWSRRLNCYSYIVGVDFIVFFASKEQYITIISKPLNIFLSKYSKLTPETM